MSATIFCDTWTNTLAYARAMQIFEWSHCICWSIRMARACKDTTVYRNVGSCHKTISVGTVSAYKTMNLLGMTRVQAKYLFYHSVAAITPLILVIGLLYLQMHGAKCRSRNVHSTSTLQARTSDLDLSSCSRDGTYWCIHKYGLLWLRRSLGFDRLSGPPLWRLTPTSHCLCLLQILIHMLLYSIRDEQRVVLPTL
jgi:hypothetical protein